MIESVEQLNEILAYIGNALTRKCTVYLIGGCAFLLHDLKDTTKDIDICCDQETANYIISDFKEADNMWNCVIGADMYLFLRVFLKDRDNINLELFTNGEYKLLKDHIDSTLVYGNLEVNIPDVKRLIMIKDMQIKQFVNEHKKHHKEEDE